MNNLTLEDFVKSDKTSAYLFHPDFEELYVRSESLIISLDINYLCESVIQIVNIKSKRPGKGSFSSLVVSIIEIGMAVYVEDVHNARFAQKLTRMGFIRVNGGNNYLYNFKDKIIPLV